MSNRVTVLTFINALLMSVCHPLSYQLTDTSKEYLDIKLWMYLFTVPGGPPVNVRARPASASTVVVEWEEPLQPNGVIKVCVICVLVICHHHHHHHHCRHYLCDWFSTS